MERLSQALLGTLAFVWLISAGPVDLEISSSPVADATELGDRDRVRALLLDGADVNAAQGDGMTALHWAAAKSDAALVDNLLYAGANVLATTRLGGFTPLLLAAKNGHAETLAGLLDSGANANDRTVTGTSALMFAAASGNVDAVRVLLDHEADIHARESTGSQTALMFAAAHDRAAVLELLISEGADPGATTEVIDAVALNEALDEGFRKRLDDLRDARAAAAAKDDEADTIAATEDDEPKDGNGKNIFRRLFGWILPGGGEEKQPEQERRQRESYGVRVGAQGGMTALLLAARQGHVNSVETLLRAGADVNQVAEGSHTSPLLIATMNGHFDLARDLLDKGADPTVAGEPANVTPLYAVLNLAWAPRAAYPQPIAQKQQRTTHLDLIESLLDKGADPNVRLAKKVWFMGYNFDRSSIDEIGATPFWRAAYGSDVAAMKLLRAYGADPNIPTTLPSERPPVASSRARESSKSKKGPPAKIGPGMSPLHGATGAGYGEGFAANDHRNHPAGFMPAVKYLVEECGADVNAIDQDGSTPLHNAAARGDVEMIEYLVSKGADVTIINVEGRSTADMANGPVQRVNPFPEARDLLVSLGAVNNNNCVSC